MTQHHDRRPKAHRGGSEPALNRSETDIVAAHMANHGCSWRDLGEACVELIGRKVDYSTLYGYAPIREARQEYIERQQEEGRKQLKAYEPKAIAGLLKRMDFLNARLEEIEDEGKANTQYLKLTKEYRDYQKTYRDLAGPIEQEKLEKPLEENTDIASILARLEQMVKPSETKTSEQQEEPQASYASLAESPPKLFS